MRWIAVVGLLGAVLLTLLPAAAQESLSQWASSATSTADESISWSADKAVGEADSLADSNDCYVADEAGWSAPFFSELETLTLYYDTPVYPELLEIYTYWTSAEANGELVYITGVEVIDVNGLATLLPNSTYAPTACPEVFTLPVVSITAPVNAVRLYVTETATDGVIDAVRLTGQTEATTFIPEPTEQKGLLASLFDLICGSAALPLSGLGALVFWKRPMFK